MSHFTVLRTQILDVDALAKALADVGFDQVEVHESAQHLYGFQGDRRPQTAEVIIRRQHIGRASNDLGFKRRADGVFDAIISDYDRRRFSSEWLGHLAQRSAYHTARAKLTEQGFTMVGEETEANGRIRLVLRRVG